MFDPAHFQTRLKEAQTLLKRTFGGDPKTLKAGLHKAGRRLPRKARLAGREIVKAQPLADHPKLQQQLDGKKLDKQFDRLIAGIKSVDMADRRKGAVLGALAATAFNLLVFFGLLLLFAMWRGWV